MAFYSLYFFSVILAVALVQAAPSPIYAKHATHNTRYFGRALKVESFHPKSTYKTFGAAGATGTSPGNTLSDASLTSDGASDSTWRLNDSAISFVRSELGIEEGNIRYRTGWTTADGRSFAYMEQSIDGIPVANAVANVAYNNNSKVVSFGSSFVETKGVTVAPSTPSIGWEETLPKIEASLDGKYNGAPPRTVYLAKQDGSLDLTYGIQVQNPNNDLWVEAHVSAHTGELLSVSDFVAHATYNVVPIQSQDVSGGREVLVDPFDPQSSPQGWHQLSETRTSQTTSGNNVVAFANDRVALESSDGLNFDFGYDLAQPQANESVSAAVTNAFYIINVMHDVSYRYGFTEAAGNFQLQNFDNGGQGDDRVVVSVQDASGVNNANFATPPDGTPGACRLFLFNRADPVRDSAMSNDVVVHEFTHGITNRMTGGGSATCLQALEAQGMGEGWSDMMAGWIAQTSDQVPDFDIGVFVSGDSTGIRSFKYSTDDTVNPLTYGDIASLAEPHQIGEVWANMLYNVYADLVQERGFSQTAMTDPDGVEGNVVFMHLMMDGLLLQPCNPTMVQARDAILQADQNRYNGANECTVFRAFARKGLGVNADGSFQNDFDVPAGC